MKKDLLKIFDRDLSALKNEIIAFKNEKDLWEVLPGISNSAGNLCLHILGNLNHFVGKNLGETGYVRERDEEFSAKNVSKAALLHDIEQTKEVVKNSISPLDEQKLEQAYVEQVFGYEMSTGFFLIHLAGHLSYHLGQVNYLRRILEG